MQAKFTSGPRPPSGLKFSELEPVGIYSAHYKDGTPYNQILVCCGKVRFELIDGKIQPISEYWSDEKSYRFSPICGKIEIEF